MAKNIKGRKFVATAATAALVASAIVPVASAAEFGDQSKISSWAADAVAHAVEKGYMQGTGGNFNPQGTVTKAQVAQVIFNALGLEAGADAKFTDVPAGQWYTDAVNALAAKDIVSGTDKGTFEPNKNVTLAEAAQMLSKALEIKGTADLSKFADASAVPTWANEAIQALVSKGYIKGGEVGGKLTLDPLGNLTRERLATMFVNIAKGELEEVEAPVTEVKVESVSATNLKEIVVTFNGAVDEETASDKANYSLKSGKSIKSVSLSEDKKSATVTLVGTLANNKVDAISISNVKAGDKVLDVKNVEFTTVDNKLPEVTSVKSLGTKSVRILFSEPITDAQQNNFTLDGKTYYGKVTLGANNRSVILTPYSSTTLSVGDHKLTIAGVKDYAGFVSLTSTQEFTVVEDKEAPTVTEAAATLESVTLTYSEEVDTETLSASKVYWKSGDSKKTASSYEVLADNKVRYYFSTSNTLPTGKVDIHVEGVKDYSGNEIAKDTKVTVTPEIDQTRPEVRKISAINGTQIKITFSKSINEDSAKAVGNYTVVDSKGKVISVQSAKVDSTDSKSVIVDLYRALTVGENTVTVKNIKDATKLQNTMLDFTGKVSISDLTNPEFDEAVNTKGRQVVLKFNKKMDIDTLTNYSNYLVKIDNTLQTLTPAIANIDVLHDATAVAITFAETISDKEVVFASGISPSSSKTNVNEITVLGLKDTSGNLLKEFKDNGIGSVTNVVQLHVDTLVALTEFDSADYPGKVAELVDTKTIEVKFTTGINSVENGAFTAKVNGTTVAIDNVVVDGSSTVTLKLKDALKTDADGLTIDVDYTKLVNMVGNKGETPVGGVHQITPSSATFGLLDSVAPTPVFAAGESEYQVVGNKIVITYSENLQAVSGAAPDLRDTDFIVTRVSNNANLKPETDYDVTIDGKTIEITLTDSRSAATAYVVTVKDAKYFTDITGNKIADSTGKSKLVASSDAQSLQTAKANAVAAKAAAATAKTAYTAAGGLTTAGVYTTVDSAITALDAAVTSNVTADIVAATTALNTAKDALVTATQTLVDAAAALADAKTAAATAKSAAQSAQLAYLTAGGLTTDTVFADVAAAITALDAAVASNVTADIVAKTTALNTAKDALVAATAAI